MRIRIATLAAAAALAAAASGCGQKCNDQTPPVAAAPNCTAIAGAVVPVPIRVCPRCDQGTPSCDVRYNSGSGRFTLEPLAEVCDPNSSCPIVNPSSCPFAPVTCTLTAPADSTQAYYLDVITPDGVLTKNLTVLAAGSPPPAQACTF
jgi:hypothetical protein